MRAGPSESANDVKCPAHAKAPLARDKKLCREGRRNDPPSAAFDEIGFDEIRQELFDLGSYMTAIGTLRYP